MSFEHMITFLIFAGIFSFLLMLLQVSDWISDKKVQKERQELLDMMSQRREKAKPQTIKMK